MISLRLLLLLVCTLSLNLKALERCAFATTKNEEKEERSFAEIILDRDVQYKMQDYSSRLKKPLFKDDLMTISNNTNKIKNKKNIQDSLTKKKS